MSCVAALAAWCFLYAACQSETGPRFDGTRALQLIEEQVALGPRIPGSEASARLVEWLDGSLTSLGWQTDMVRTPYGGVELTNVIAYRGTASRGRILLGTHFDTRPRADLDPVTPDAPVPGANDGASGTAVLLELARVLAERDDLPQVTLAFFDGEDSGNLAGWEWSAGASAYAAGLRELPEAVVIIDMVGDAKLRLPREHSSDPGLADDLWRIAHGLGADAFVDEVGGAILDDHRPFSALGVPSVLIIDMQYAYWHTTADTSDKVSASSLEQVGSVLHAWVLSRR